MSTSRLADSRIRAAASQVVGLDVRGPVSRALGQIPVPLADEADVPTSATPPAKTPRRTGAKAAQRVHKPFAEAPWPTQKAKAEPKAVLSGLTADERRVHRILLDTLAIQSEYAYHNGAMSTPGLSYAEKQKLAVLDLAFIDAEIDKMERGFSMSPRAVRFSFAIGAAIIALVAGVLLLVGEGEAALFMTAVTGATLFAAVGLASLMSNATPSSTPRRKIYAALRELAFLVDDAPVSDALQQADAVIDRLAGAVPGGMAASDDAPRLRLDDAPPSTASGASTRTRTRH